MSSRGAVFATAISQLEHERHLGMATSRHYLSGLATTHLRTCYISQFVIPRPRELRGRGDLHTLAWITFGGWPHSLGSLTMTIF